jgi:hypothetical protein
MGLSKRDVKIATIFTGVEIVTLTAWFAVINNPILAVITLGVGLELEHLISRLKG